MVMTKLFAFALSAIVSACVPAAGYQGGYSQPAYAAPAYVTGIYINGQELTVEHKAQLEALVGESVPAGRYTLDAQYNFGYEGQPPAINLATYVRARQATPYDSTQASSRGGDKPFSMYSTDSAGQGSSLVSDGNGCTIMSTPSGSISSGC